MTPPPLVPPYLVPTHLLDEQIQWGTQLPFETAPAHPNEGQGDRLAPTLDLRGAIAEGLRWLAIATLLRIAVEATLLQAPLWSLSGLAGLALLLAPAAIGLYLSHHYPALRLVLAYRLMFILLGLLLGGRL